MGVEQKPEERGVAQVGARTVRGRRALVVVGATAADLVLWALAHPVAGIGLRVHLGGSVQSVGLGSVAAAALAAGLAAWALLALLERILQGPRRAWTIIAVTVLVVSLAGPLGATTTASMMALALMHLTLAAVLISGLRRSAPGQ